MIKPETFTKEWIETIREKSQYKKADKASIEKMIYALALLEKLAENQFDFIFKGGTALVLLFEETYRFSIDIDIITLIERSDLEQILTKIVQSSIFTNWEIDERRSFTHNLPKAHYKLTYTKSNFGLGNTVLLDVMFTGNQYPELTLKQIKTPWLSTQEPYLLVNVPTIESILGDKLTAFAPNTTGVKYGIDKSVEIIKQLFDISHLIDKATNLNVTYNSFVETAMQEIQFRNIKHQPVDVVKDIFNTALILAKREKNETPEAKRNFAELQQGIKNMENFQVQRNFKIEQAIEAAAKAAWFTELLQQNKFNEFILFSNSIDMTNWIVQNIAYNFLNRFKKTNKAAFYYWYKCLYMNELLNE